MTHFAYVAAAYAASFATIGGLVLWVWLDGRARRLELAALEASGIRRRSSTETK